MLENHRNIKDMIWNTLDNWPTYKDVLLIILQAARLYMFPEMLFWQWYDRDYYHPKSSKSRFAQCFQWFCNHSEKAGNLVENRTILENAAFYQDAPENSDRRHCSCQALSLCKKARRKLMHLSLRLAFLHQDRAWQEQCRRSEFSGAAW